MNEYDDRDSSRDIAEVVGRKLVPKDHGQHQRDCGDDPENDLGREAQNAQHALRLAELPCERSARRQVWQGYS